jgi:peroxiredoxin
VILMLTIGQKASDFQGVPGTDGRQYQLASFDDTPVLVLVFTCNGCPTVKANEGRLITLQETYRPQGVGLVAINSNNASLSPSDTLAEMVVRAQEKRFNFPYLKDADGSIARAYGALSTPHAFVLDHERRLRYKGRIDDTRDPARATRRDLEQALADVLADRAVRIPETQPFGCAIVH